MSHEMLIDLAAGAALLSLMAYAIFAGADFGGGVWDLFATGPRRRGQREAIARAMGPVWEANHVWLIFMLVILFTCFPRGYGPLGIALFVPFHLAVFGIMLRGAAFVFRESGPFATTASALTETPSIWRRLWSWWGMVFGIASVISPVLLGVAFGVLTKGQVRIDPEGTVLPLAGMHWLSPYSLTCGILALSTCAYLAAVYLTVETDGSLREDFRQRAIIAGTTTAALAMFVVLLSWFEARWFFERLMGVQTWPVLAAGLFCFGASAWAVFGRQYKLSRMLAAAEIVLLLLGWGLSQRPFLVYPDMTFQRAAAPAPTIAFLLATLPPGALLLLPSLWMLYRVFKVRG